MKMRLKHFFYLRVFKPKLEGGFRNESFLSFIFNMLNSLFNGSNETGSLTQKLLHGHLFFFLLYSLFFSFFKRSYYYVFFV